ncbi:hypothetical protein A8709_24350 [Paenibacillus pectinilyticus]|uniref:Uncharacterized protein n=1 Tax=Paenibacillus pectinilyticus TaxID=512399 RepID=A0A1C1A932_9BACL|nr:hypothetical protein [Paenibacillus pectinilyticus]OCT17119.1 hypothetical protein A8709_24350 [Paenibacillus pectinilyticus]
MSKKWITLTAITAISLVSLTACTDNTKVKEAFQQSVNKQTEMKSYTFDGNTTLSISDGLMKSANPLTNGLLSLIRESTITWKGISNVDPLQFQTDLQVTAKGSTSPIAIPILIKDSKMYFNMPVLNKTADEYYAIDLQKMSQSSSPLTADTLKNSSQVSSTLSKLIFEGIDAKWYKESKDPVKLSDGTSAKSIQVDLTSKNEKEINKQFQTKLPEFVDTLKSNGFLSADKAEVLKKNDLGSLQLKAPSSMKVAIDDKGFIRDQTLDITFAVTVDGKALDNHILLHQTYDAINQGTPLSKEVPAKVKSFDDILKLVAPAAKK